MNLENLLNQFLGSGNSPTTGSNAGSPGLGDVMGNIASQIPGGLAGGAAAGGIVALLLGSKKARKFAGTAATYGGAALLGGLAFKAYQNWKNTQADQPASTTSSAATEQAFHQQALSDAAVASEPFELTLIKGMIAAARADGHIDAKEQGRIFEAVERMDLSIEHKGVIFDFLKQEIPIEGLVRQTPSIETKSELYLASCLVIDLDHPAERAHLDRLAAAMGLPAELSRQLEIQAAQALSQGA
jgi:uncharacterized membrane protein YebE (DUF533 family)